MNAGPDFEANRDKAFAMVREAASHDARLVALPENFSFLRTGREIPFLSHSLDSPFVRELGALARELGIHLLAGSFHEPAPDGKHLYNTSTFFGPDGTLLGVYRKIHLFDIAIPGQSGFRESDRFSPGEETVVCRTQEGVMGMAICYDLRFPELFRRLSAQGAEILLVPSAFTVATGKDHWDILVRCRAIENLAYVVAPALTGSPSDRIHNLGRSMIVDPWGIVLAEAGQEEGLLYAEVDRDYLRERRSRLPALEHRRLG